jgi:hypothetical protein
MHYPLDLRFKIATIGTRVRVTDAGGNLVAYVRKKKFRLKEDIGVYADEDQRKLLFRIKADRMLDFGASYSVALPTGRRSGPSGRRGCAPSGRAPTPSLTRPAAASGPSTRRTPG